MALTGFATNKLSTSRPTLTSRAINSKRFTNIRGNYSNLSNPTIPLPYFVLSTDTLIAIEDIGLAIIVRGYNLPISEQNGTYYWTIESNAGDFSTTSGNFNMTWNGDAYGFSFGTFRITPTNESVIEGTEYFTVAIRSGSISGTVIAIASLSINDPAPYFTFTSTPNPVTEGDTATINVQGYNLAVESGTYYWTIQTNAVDFGTTSGSFTLASGAGSFTISPTIDRLLEDTEYFSIAIRSGSTTGPIISTSSPLSIINYLVDNNFNYVSLLLLGNGTNTANNASFLDSANNFNITRTGNPGQGTFSPYSINSSIYFEGLDSTGGEEDHLTVTSSTALNFTGQYTVECWFLMPKNLARTDGLGFYRGRLVSSYIDMFNGSQFSLDVTGIYQGTAVPSAIDGGGITASGLTILFNTWYHVAVVRDAFNTTSIFLNGSRVATGIVATSFATGTTRIAGDVNSSGAYAQFNGYISQVRAVKGTAIYNPASTSITVPTTPLTAISGTSLLTCQGGCLVDASTNAYPITSGFRSTFQQTPIGPFLNTVYSANTISGSAHFDGTSDYLTIPHDTSLDVSTGDFTVECWFYVTQAEASRPILTRYNGSSATRNDSQYSIIYNSSDTQLDWVGSLTISPYASTTNYDMTFSSVKLKVWHHCALVRSGNNFYAYLDGVRNATTQTISGSLNTGTWSTYIGAQNSSRFNGYISDVRVVKGSALYTNATYTVPTTALTAISGTSLLTKFSNAGIVDNAMKNSLKTVGDVKISTTQSKFGGSSIYFDGTADYVMTRTSIGIDQSALYDFGARPFTIEMWIYNTVSNVERTLIFHGWSGSGGFNFGWRAFINSSNQLSFYANGSTPAFTDLTISANTWTHIAFVGSGGILSAYKDGVKSATTLTYTSIVDRTTMPVVIGGWNNNTESIAERSFYTGYINDLRITKGVARYTATFPLPTIASPIQ